MPVLSTPARTIDYLEAGTGPVVLLLHSSVSGNRQWRALMAELADRHHVIAPNLIGYGRTDAWPGERPQTLGDQSALIEPFLARHAGPVALIGHSFGATVAMRVALDHPDRVTRLMLLEPNLSQMLRHHQRNEVFAEADKIRELVKGRGGRGEWEHVAARFADYWNGEGTWAAMPDERRTTFTAALRPNYHEWDAVLADTSLIEGLSRIAAETLVVWARDTRRPMIEAVDVLKEHRPQWRYLELPEGGHMFPLTRPALLNPIVRAFLGERDDEHGCSVVT